MKDKSYDFYTRINKKQNISGGSNKYKYLKKYSKYIKKLEYIK